MGYFAIDTGPHLKHYGVLGMKWGVRRYENPDGTLTEAGKRRYNKRYGYSKNNLYGNIHRTINSIRLNTYRNKKDKTRYNNEIQKILEVNPDTVKSFRNIKKVDKETMRLRKQWNESPENKAIERKARKLADVEFERIKKQLKGRYPLDEAKRDLYAKYYEELSEAEYPKYRKKHQEYNKNIQNWSRVWDIHSAEVNGAALSAISSPFMKKENYRLLVRDISDAAERKANYGRAAWVDSSNIAKERLKQEGERRRQRKYENQKRRSK